MKRQLFVILITTTSLHATVFSNSITIHPYWETIESNRSHEKELGGKWMLVGSITFQKKSKEQAKLERMRLAWHGTPIHHLYGSLYKKLPNQKFVPIEQNVVCDSKWNKARQELILNFENNKQTLGPTSIFYLVLTVPQEIETTLKHGHFSLIDTDLPASFQTYSDDLKLDLAQFAAQDQNISAHA